MDVSIAHETWFVPDYDRFGLDWAFAAQTATLALLAAAVALALAVRQWLAGFPALVLLVMGSDPRLRPLVSNLRPAPT